MANKSQILNDFFADETTDLVETLAPKKKSFDDVKASFFEDIDVKDGVATTRTKPPEQVGVPEDTGFFGGVVEIGRAIGRGITGELRQTPETRELPETFGEAVTGGLDQTGKEQLKTIAGLLVSLSPEQQEDIVKANLPDSTTRRDSKGNLIITKDGKSTVLNKPGLSLQDGANFTFQALAALGGESIGLFTANLINKIPLLAKAGVGLGETARAGVVGTAGATTSAGLDVAAAQLGSEQGISARTALSTGVLEFVGTLISQRLGLRKLPKGFLDETGALTKEGKEAVVKRGLNPDDLSEEIKQELAKAPRAAVAEETVRKGEIREITGADPTTGAVTQRKEDIAREQIVGAGVGEQAQALEATKRGLQEGLVEKATDFAETIGAPEKTLDAAKRISGQTAKESLESTKKVIRKQVSDLYDNVEELAGVSIPVSQEGIATAFARAKREFGFRAEKAIGDLQTALEEFSVIPPSKKILKEEADLGGIIKPLTIGNAEKLRQRFNTFVTSDDKNVRQVARDMLKSLDDTLEELKLVDTLAPEVVDAFKTARKAHRDFKADFSAKDIVEQLTSVKKGTDTPVIPPSAVIDEILLKKGRFEKIARIKRSLNRPEAGKEGKAAWDNLRGSIALELMGKAIDRKGVFNIKQFRKAQNDLGQGVLKQFYTKDELQKFSQIERVAKDLSFDKIPGLVNKGAIESFVQLPFVRRMLLFRPLTGSITQGFVSLERKGLLNEALNLAKEGKITKDQAVIMGNLSEQGANAFQALLVTLGRTSPQIKEALGQDEDLK